MQQLSGLVNLPSVFFGLVTIIVFNGGESAECPSGGNLSVSKGMMWSPGFPRSYPDNTVCVWVITAPRGEHVKLTLKTVDLEYCTLCHCDYVEVREGARPDGKLIGRFCKANRTVVYSEGTQIWIKFKSDSKNKRRGFLAGVSRLKLRKRSPVKLHANKTSRFITSSDNPAVCGSGKQCTWVISADKGFNVRLTLDVFMFPSCLGSFIEIRDGSATSSELIGRFCGDKKPPPDICSSGNSMRVTFTYKSAGDLRINRFKLMYRAIHCTNLVQKQTFIEPVNNDHLKSMVVGIACSSLLLFVILVTCFVKIASSHSLTGVTPSTSQIELNPTETSIVETPLCNEMDVSND